MKNADKVTDKIYISTWNIDKGDNHYSITPTDNPVDKKNEVEYIRSGVVLDWIRSAYGKVSMNPFDCSEAFKELIKKIKKSSKK